MKSLKVHQISKILWLSLNWVIGRASTQNKSCLINVKLTKIYIFPPCSKFNVSYTIPHQNLFFAYLISLPHFPCYTVRQTRLSLLPPQVKIETACLTQSKNKWGNMATENISLSNSLPWMNHFKAKRESLIGRVAIELSVLYQNYSPLPLPSFARLLAPIHFIMSLHMQLWEFDQEFSNHFVCKAQVAFHAKQTISLRKYLNVFLVTFYRIPLGSSETCF